MRLGLLVAVGLMLPLAVGAQQPPAPFANPAGRPQYEDADIAVSARRATFLPDGTARVIFELTNRKKDSVGFAIVPEKASMHGDDGSLWMAVKVTGIDDPKKFRCQSTTVLAADQSHVFSVDWKTSERSMPKRADINIVIMNTYLYCGGGQKYYSVDVKDIALR